MGFYLNKNNSKKFKMLMKVALLVLLNAVYMAQANPAHASCQLQWDFAGMTCDKVMNKIVNQIDAWSGEELCMTGTDQVNEKCLYTLTYRDEDTFRSLDRFRSS